MPCFVQPYHARQGEDGSFRQKPPPTSDDTPAPMYQLKLFSKVAKYLLTAFVVDDNMQKWQR
jgi:hypothetical protein